MIFKLEGVRNLLALTPVLREWKKRGLGEVLVETPNSDVFIGNPDVDEVSLYFKRDDQEVLDLDQVAWQSEERHVTESYAIAAFGDASLEKWRMSMTHSEEEDKEAVSMMEEGNVALVGPGFSENRQLVSNLLRDLGYNVLMASGDVGWGVYRALAEHSALYVGEQGDESVVAMTTDVPGVVVYNWESPVYFAPIRKMAMFEPVVPPVEVCNIAPACLGSNGVYEFGRTFGVRCSKKSRYGCKSWDCIEAIMEAVAKVKI